jgi:hypothetical protein
MFCFKAFAQSALEPAWKVKLRSVITQVAGADWSTKLLGAEPKIEERPEVEMPAIPKQKKSATDVSSATDDKGIIVVGKINDPAIILEPGKTGKYNIETDQYDYIKPNAIVLVNDDKSKLASYYKIIDKEIKNNQKFLTFKNMLDVPISWQKDANFILVSPVVLKSQSIKTGISSATSTLSSMVIGKIISPNDNLDIGKTGTYEIETKYYDYIGPNTIIVVNKDNKLAYYIIKL